MIQGHGKRSGQLQVSGLWRVLSSGRAGEFLLGHTAETAGRTSCKPGSFVADESKPGCIVMGEGCTARLGVRKVVEPGVGVVGPLLCMYLAEIGRGRWFGLKLFQSEVGRGRVGPRWFQAVSLGLLAEEMELGLGSTWALKTK